MYDKLPFFGIKVHATSIGPVTQIPIGIMGTMAQMIFWDVRDKTSVDNWSRPHRSGSGRPCSGSGGNCRRIVLDYAAGRSRTGSNRGKVTGDGAIAFGLAVPGACYTEVNPTQDLPGRLFLLSSFN
jgi:hypothetical protein